jgi:nitroreductase
VVAIVGNQGAYFDERDRHLIYIDGSLAAMAFQFGLETLGLSSCCINWPAIYSLENKMETLLHLEKYERIVMFLSVGYPDPEGLVPYSQKKVVDELRSFNNREQEIE